MTISSKRILETLPSELLLTIFSHLPITSLVSLHSTSRFFNHLLRDHAESLWIRLCHQHSGFPFDTLHAIHARLHAISYRDLFTHFIHRYGYLVGVWFGDQRPHGDILVVEWDTDDTSLHSVEKASPETSDQRVHIKAFRLHASNTAAIPYYPYSQNPTVFVSNLRLHLDRNMVFSITLTVSPPSRPKTDSEDRISLTTICHEDAFNQAPHSIHIVRNIFRPHSKTGLWELNHRAIPFPESGMMGSFETLGELNLFNEVDAEYEILNGEGHIANTPESRERISLRQMVVSWDDALETNSSTMSAPAYLAGSSLSSSSTSSTTTSSTNASSSSSSFFPSSSPSPSSSSTVSVPTVNTSGAHWTTASLSDLTPSFALTCTRKPPNFTNCYARLPDFIARHSPSLPSTLSPSSTPVLHDLNGIWAGDYGSHGVEILLLHTLRTAFSPRTVVALKLTGDPNVPRSEISWAAYMDEREVSRICQEPEFRGHAAYRGWGQVAGLGFVGASFINVDVVHVSNSELAVHFLPLQLFSRYHRLHL